MDEQKEAVVKKEQEEVVKEEGFKGLSVEESKENKQEDEVVVGETDWLKVEEESVSQPSGDYEKLPAPKFEQGKLTVMFVDFSKAFGKWTDPETHKVKAIIPCTTVIDGEEGVRCNWWLNLKNPVYKDVIQTGRSVAECDRVGVKVCVLQTGSGDKTRYTFVKE